MEERKLHRISMLSYYELLALSIAHHLDTWAIFIVEFRNLTIYLIMFIIFKQLNIEKAFNRTSKLLQKLQRVRCGES